MALLGSVLVVQEQTKPRCLGPNDPKTEMFIGNSFLYYNNGMPAKSHSWKGPPIPTKSDYHAATVTIGRKLEWHEAKSYSGQMRSAASASTTITTLCER